MRDRPKQATILFVMLTFIFSAVFWALNLWHWNAFHLTKGGGASIGPWKDMLVPGVMWCPALAALVSCRILGRRFRSLAWRWPEGKYVALSYLVPLGYVAVAWVIVWAARLGGWNSDFVNTTAQSFSLRGMPPWGTFAIYVLLYGVIGMIHS